MSFDKSVFLVKMYVRAEENLNLYYTNFDSGEQIQTNCFATVMQRPYPTTAIQ
jgi:hypothetical protein